VKNSKKPKKEKSKPCATCGLTLEQQKQVGIDVEIRTKMPTEKDPNAVRISKPRICGTCILALGNLIDGLRQGGQWDALVYHEQKKRGAKKIIVPGQEDIAIPTPIDIRKKFQ
jgi:hypothetical protein